MAHCIISRMLVYAGCVALQKSRYVIVSQMVVQKGCGALLSMVHAGRGALCWILLVVKERHDLLLRCSIWHRVFQHVGVAVRNRLCEFWKLFDDVLFLGVQVGYLLIKLSSLFFQLRHNVADACSLLACGGTSRHVRAPACESIGVETCKAADTVAEHPEVLFEVHKFSLLVGSAAIGLRLWMHFLPGWGNPGKRQVNLLHGIQLQARQGLELAASL